MNCVDCFGVTPLFEAVRNGHGGASEVLFQAGGTLGLAKQTDCLVGGAQKDEGTLLCTVASKADVFYLQRLLKYGLPVNASDYDGRTGLHLAAAAGHYSVIECLLSNGKEMRVVLRDRCSELIAILRSVTGADPSPLDRFGRTPLLEVCL